MNYVMLKCGPFAGHNEAQDFIRKIKEKDDQGKLHNFNYIIESAVIVNTYGAPDIPNPLDDDDL